jgi:hypothetical protein
MGEREHGNSVYSRLKRKDKRKKTKGERLLNKVPLLGEPALSEAKGGQGWV